MSDSQHYDVVVAGGGSAGVAAAVGARRLGARTLLVEQGACLGGAATLRNVLTYCGLHRRDDREQVVFGVAEDLLTRLRAVGGVSAPTRFTGVSVVVDPESVKVALDDLCDDAGVDVLLHTQVDGADQEAGAIRQVHLAARGRRRTVTASAFVDATGDGQLAWQAGAEVRYGNGGEVQNASLGVRFGGLPGDVHVSREALTAAVRTARADGNATLRSEGGLLARLPVSGDLITYVVDEAYDARDAAQVGRAERSGRRQAQAYLAVLRTLPGCGSAYIVSTGPELGTRESRHVVARRQLTAEEVLHPEPSADTVALGAWPVEIHGGPGVPVEWAFIGGPGHYGIPLDTLRSRSFTNLLAAGRCLDGDRRAGASMRVMGTALATGHAAGVTAGLIAAGAPCAAPEVRDELQRQDARLP